MPPIWPAIAPAPPIMSFKLVLIWAELGSEYPLGSLSVTLSFNPCHQPLTLPQPAVNLSLILPAIA